MLRVVAGKIKGNMGGWGREPVRKSERKVRGSDENWPNEVWTNLITKCCKCRSVWYVCECRFTIEYVPSDQCPGGNPRTAQ